MKRVILASAFAAAMALGLPSAADAKVSIGVFFGSPHYDYRVGPGYVYRDGYGWYQPSYSSYRGRLSCGEAKRHIRSQGFKNVDTVECNGRTYTFEATRRGRDYTLYVNSRTGRISRS